MHSPEAVISIDLGGTKCAAALIHSRGELQFHYEVKYGNASGDAVGSIILGMVEGIIAQAGPDHSKIAGIGISVPGIVNVGKGTVWAPNIGGWEEYPLHNALVEGLSVKGLPVFIESDRACCILGENWKGAARGSSNAVFLSVGTGIGAGIMVDGKILRGLNDIAGAIGWMALQRPFDEKLAPFGCFEYYASGDGLVRAAREFMQEEPSSGPGADPAGNLTSEHLFEAFRKNDPIAMRVFEQAIGLWGMASANLVSLLNPEKVIFGGGVFGPGIQFIDRIYEEACKWAQPVAIRQASFLGSLLQGQAQLFGAAFQVFINDPQFNRECCE